MSGDDTLLAKAAQLEDQARTEPLSRARELGLEASRLRMQVLGEKPYPVLACSQCWQLTGWLGSDDRCDVCIASAKREAAYADPQGSWVQFEERAPRARGQGPATWKRLAAAIGVDGPLVLARNAAWGEKVDTGVTGPPTPEDGFVVFGAERVEWPAPEGHDLLIRFSPVAYQFAGGAWHHTIQTGGPVPVTPHVFPASLPMDQLAEAWSDYKDEIGRWASERWAAEDARREAEREDAKATAEAREDQTGTSTLLD
ncbi:MAG TPA: hypothetical protein VH817_15875 [Thermoleophilaceae bacterium]